MGRRRSQVVCLGVTGVLAAAATGCGAPAGGTTANEEPQYVGVCVDKSSGMRLDDAVCADAPVPAEADFTAAPPADATPTPDSTVWTESTPGAGSGASTETTAPETTAPAQRGSVGWFFIPFGMWAPPIGSRATAGSYAPPSGSTYARGGMAPSGGTASASSVKGGKVTTSRGGFGNSGGKAGS